MLSIVLMDIEATATPLVEPETVIVAWVPLKVGVPMLVIAVAVVGVPNPVRTAEPVPVEAKEPVATVFAVPSVKSTTTFSAEASSLSSTSETKVIFFAVPPVATAEPVPVEATEPVATVFAVCATGTVMFVKVRVLEVSVKVSPLTEAVMPAKEFAEALLAVVEPDTPCIVVVTSFAVATLPITL